MHHQLHPDANFMMPESMTHSEDHSTALLEDVVADDLSRQIDDIAETLQREGWPKSARITAISRRWGSRSP